MVELRSKKWAWGFAIGWTALVSSCGTDLGECDMTKLGGSEVPGMLAPQTGQKIVNNSCAGGSCHSDQAEGKERNGAPAGLDFDVVPTDLSDAQKARVIANGTTVHNEAEEMWALIDSGDMPPEGQRAALTGEDKEAVRNWLACGAKLIVAPATTGPVGANLTEIHEALSDLACKSCHTGDQDNGFLASDACAMHTALVGKPAVAKSANNCASSGMMLVVPGQPESSLFLKKLMPSPPCGGSMPFGGTPLSQSDSALVESIRSWIAAGAPKPAGCP